MGSTCVVHDVRVQARHRLELLVREHAGVDEVVGTHEEPDLLARAGSAGLVVLGTTDLGDAAALVRRLRAAAPGAAVLVAGSPDDPAAVAAALGAGAVGFLRWDAPRAMARTLTRVAADGAAGGGLVPPVAGGADGRDTAASGRVRVDLAAQRAVGLSVREVQVLVGVSRGLTNADIARRLYLSGATVKSHLARATRRLGAADRAGAVGRAWELGVFVRADALAKGAHAQSR